MFLCEKRRYRMYENAWQSLCRSVFKQMNESKKEVVHRMWVINCLLLTGKKEETLRLVWVFHYSQKYNGKQKLYYLGNPWIKLVEANCLGKWNKFKKDFPCPVCSLQRDLHLWFLLYISDLWLLNHVSVTISYHMLSFLSWNCSNDGNNQPQHSLEMTIESTP